MNPPPPIKGMFHCGTCSRWRWWPVCWGLFNLPPLSPRVVEWCGGRPSCRRGLGVWRRPACVHTAWDAPLRTGSRWSVRPHCRSPTGKQTKTREQMNIGSFFMHKVRPLWCPSVSSLVLVRNTSLKKALKTTFANSFKTSSVLCLMDWFGLNNCFVHKNGGGGSAINPYCNYHTAKEM